MISTVQARKSRVQHCALWATKRHELWAEAIRDIGILFLVFAPLETLLRKDRGSWVDWLVAGTIAILGLLLIEKGVRMGTEK